MIVRTLADVAGTEREVDAGNWYSRRLILARDGISFSLHDTVIRAGTETEMWYRHHVEAVYCIEGEGTLDDLESGLTYELRPGTVYVLDGHERHRVRATTDLRMVCVFDPPVTGREVHDESGAYPLVADGADGADRADQGVEPGVVS
ncbi:MAG: ectoine synthase [Acidimicrobiia bacterium]|nr:ectoine synthase [Acidimicrobiia bacterium]